MIGLSEDFADGLAQEIRRVDGNHDLGAGALAEALVPWLAARAADDGLRAQVEALADRWAEVVSECKATDPRWILDAGVMAIQTAHNELRAALAETAPTAEGAES